MNDIAGWFTHVEQAWRGTIGLIVSYLPNLAGVAILLAIGWVLARWTRTGVHKLGDVINRLIGNIFQSSGLARFRLTERSLQIIGNAAFWLVVLMFLTAAAKVARLDAFSLWLDRILSYVPVLLTGALIIAAGYLASLFVRDIVSAALSSGGFRQSVLLARLAQATVFLTALVVGIDQIGVDVSFLVTVIAIALSSVLGGIALAFGFGSRDFVANVIAAHNLQQHYRPGHMVRFGKTRGEILELTPTSVILATEEGRTTVPAKVFHRNVSVLVTPEEAGE
ncbi:MAG: mechanosensitive ion channel [Burkholderiales bacterium]|nr:mechanosensitive ion channel [Burkholderiales bacterium]